MKGRSSCGFGGRERECMKGLYIWRVRGQPHGNDSVCMV